MELNVGRAIAPFVRLVEAITRRVDYLAWYRAEVVGQNGDFSLELRPKDARVPPLSKVPIRHGLPGYSVKVKKGALVLLGWEDGDPQRPVAALWESGVVEEVVFTATGELALNAAKVKLTAAGAQPVARQGDLVATSTPPQGSQILITLGAPGATGPALMGAPLPATLVILPQLPLIGQISTGNPSISG